MDLKSFFNDLLNIVGLGSKPAPEQPQSTQPETVIESDPGEAPAFHTSGYLQRTDETPAQVTQEMVTSEDLVEQEAEIEHCSMTECCPPLTDDSGFDTPSLAPKTKKSRSKSNAAKKPAKKAAKKRNRRPGK